MEEQFKEYAEYLTRASSRIWVNTIGPPDLSAYNEETESWRLLRLAQVADQMEKALPESMFAAVYGLYDRKGALTLHVHPQTSDAELASIRYAAKSAWGSHNEYEIEIEVMRIGKGGAS